MSSDPAQFARRVLEAFSAAGLITDEEVGDAGGPSTTTLAKYRKVASGEMNMNEPRGDVLRRIDKAAGWASGSARALWRDDRNPSPPGPSLSEILTGRAMGKTGRTVRVDSPENYMHWIAERLTEVEERLDLLAEEMRAARDERTLRSSPEADREEQAALSDPSGGVPLAIAALDEEESIAGEQEQTENS